MANEETFIQENLLTFSKNESVASEPRTPPFQPSVMATPFQVGAGQNTGLPLLPVPRRARGVVLGRAGSQHFSSPTKTRATVLSCLQCPSPKAQVSFTENLLLSLTPAPGTSNFQNNLEKNGTKMRDSNQSYSNQHCGCGMRTGTQMSKGRKGPCLYNVFISAKAANLFDGERKASSINSAETWISIQKNINFKLYFIQ